MRPKAQREEVNRLVALGENDCAIARQTGIPRTTVRDIRRPRKRPATGSARQRPRSCPRCESQGLDPAAYAYLLGVYLGDGHIVRCGRTQRLRIFCDLQHANVWWEIAGTVDRVGNRRPALQLRPPTGLCIVSAYWNHWPCLFPQHGPGRKHERAIVLESWQAEIVDAHPDRFVRGLIHSDGCRSLNTIRHPKRTYAYPRYEFCNRSEDIRDLFCAACDRLGVPWTQMNRWTISVARREAVATLDQFVGPKS